MKFKKISEKDYNLFGPEFNRNRTGEVLEIIRRDPVGHCTTDRHRYLFKDNSFPLLMFEFDYWE